MLSKYNETHVDYSLYHLTPNNSSSYIVSTTDINLIKSLTWFSLQPTPPYYRKPNNTKQGSTCSLPNQ